MDLISNKPNARKLRRAKGNRTSRAQARKEQQWRSDFIGKHRYAAMEKALRAENPDLRIPQVAA